MSRPKQPVFQHTERITPGNRLLRINEVKAKVGKSAGAIYAEIRRHTFPAPLAIGTRSVAWLEEEVDRWIAQRLAERQEKLKHR